MQCRVWYLYLFCNLIILLQIFNLLECVKGNYSMQSGQGNWNVEFNSSSSAYWKNEVGSTNFLLYQGSFPQNIATPNRKRPNVDDGKVCKSCGADNTPLWRKGPEGPQVSISQYVTKSLKIYYFPYTFVFVLL